MKPVDTDRDLEIEGYALARGYEAGEWARTSNHGPAILTAPDMQSGQPCIRGTRVPATQMAAQWWVRCYLTLEDQASDYAIRPADIIVACWWVGMHGTRTWRPRYGAWARSVDGQLWRGDYDVMLPPQRKW